MPCNSASDHGRPCALQNIIFRDIKPEWKADIESSLAKAGLSNNWDTIERCVPDPFC